MHQLVTRVYGEVAQRTASDSVTELAVFQQITGELERVAQAERPQPAAWGSAISRNMQLWTLLATDLMQPGNLLPDDTKQGLLKLGLFVLSHSNEVLAQRADMNVLIDINRSIMAGLEHQPGREAA